MFCLRADAHRAARNKETIAMKITAKTSTNCPCCNAQIFAGESVEWSPNVRIHHVAYTVANAAGVAVDWDFMAGFYRSCRRATVRSASARIRNQAAVLAAS